MRPTPGPPHQAVRLGGCEPQRLKPAPLGTPHTRKEEPDKLTPRTSVLSVSHNRRTQRANQWPRSSSGATPTQLQLCLPAGRAQGGARVAARRKQDESTNTASAQHGCTTASLAGTRVSGRQGSRGGSHPPPVASHSDDQPGTFAPESAEQPMFSVTPPRAGSPSPWAVPAEMLQPPSFTVPTPPPA